LATHSIKKHLKHLAKRENRANENAGAIDLDEGLPETRTSLGQSSLFKKQSTNPHQCQHSVEI
jgi:hypothetical protein